MSRRHEIQLADREVDEFLHSRDVMVLGTLGPNGWPHLVSMRYGWYEGSLAFQGYAKSQKFANLRRDPRVTILVEDAHCDYAEIKGVQLVGTARLVDDPDVALAVLQSALAINPDYMERSGIGYAKPEVITQKRTAAILEVNRVISWDHRRLNGKY